MSRFTALALVAVALAAGPAGAATLDFTQLRTGPGLVDQPVVTVEGANLFSGGGAFFVGAAGSVNSICALDVVANSCDNTLLIAFRSDVTALSFTVAGFDAGVDDVMLSLFGAQGGLAGSLAIAGNGNVDLSAFGTLAALLFEPVMRGANGASYGDFTFDVAPPPMAAVPLPAGLPLLLGGLGMLGVARRRRAV